MLKARQCLREIREYHSPLSEGDFDLRLDMNESTTGCSPRVLARLRQIDAKKLALYPPREPAEQMVSALLGKSPSQVLLTNGVDEGIDLLCRAYLNPDDEVIIVVPTFAMYEIFAQSAGANVIRVRTTAEEDFAFPTENVLQAITPRTRLIVITNPNNPTGIAVDRYAITRVAQAAADAAVLVDEAYFDYYGQTIVDQVGLQIPNLFVARTFSKAYGMAGLRLGALAGPTQHISVLRRISGPFNVNACALEVVRDALTDRQFVTDHVNQVKEAREWFSKEIEEMGFKTWPSQGNFILVNFGEEKDYLLKQMREWGIALRDRPDLPGFIRITIGKQKEMEVVSMGLKQALENKRKPAQPEEAQPAASEEDQPSGSEEEQTAP
ncbi:MAG TPA: histidinol-phosphate transaminase [Candidatus Angelobacter sp.]|nr:histidinol-phosphate transaminase [Candidatus Angelobacter sp.]